LSTDAGFGLRVAAIADAARTENIQCARRIALIGELYERRAVPVEDSHGRELWRIDPWDSVAAEIGAALRVTAAAAGALIHTAPKTKSAIWRSR
jgi:hypothetical protein